MDVEAMVRPVVENAGLELVGVGFVRDQGRRVLRVTVDREGGVNLDAIAEVSERISRRLDLEGFDPLGGPYALEVSSPGVERPLKDARDFARRVGEQVKVKTASPVEGSRTLRGTIVSATPSEVRLATEQGEQIVPFELITSARTVFEWGAGGVRR
jgi:ribosome maturation factor RimP